MKRMRALSAFLAAAMVITTAAPVMADTPDAGQATVVSDSAKSISQTPGTSKDTGAPDAAQSPDTAAVPESTQPPVSTETEIPAPAPTEAETPAPSETPAETENTEPSGTPVETETPEPSQTPEATETPAPTETPVEEVQDDVLAAKAAGDLNQVMENGKKYFIFDDGTRLTGWYQMLPTWKLYLDPNDNGAAVVGYKKIDGKEYVFNKDGIVIEEYGTPIIDGKKYWIVGDGSLRTGWMTLGNMKLYFDPVLKYALTGISKVGDKHYLFDKNGVLVALAGTPVYDGKKFWFKEDGSLGTGWMTLTNWIMYFDPETFEAAVGRKEVGGKKYLFNKDGVCYTYSRTEVVDGKKYWFATGGTIETGWKNLSGMIMYFYPDTWNAAIGKVTIDGEQYYFDDNGVLRSETPTVSVTTAQMEVIRNIFYAVESGGHVYGNNNYADVTGAGTNTSNEVAITIGAGQWYATEAQKLLKLIRTTDPAGFAQLDTAGIGTDLDNENWSRYDIPPKGDKGQCISKIIDSPAGRKCQDQLMNEQILQFMQEASDLGVTETKAQAMCANFRHQGGKGAMVRIINKTTLPYTLDNLYNSCKTDTGNQVGAYKSRQKFVYENLKSRM